jgi:glycosyltransferase involved in cell wall biosynthesis
MPVARVHMVAGPLYLESRVIRRVEQLLSKLDHVVVGGSAYTSRAYRALGLSVVRTPSVPYGVDTDAFTPPSPDSREAARNSLNLSADAFAVIMVSYVYAPKRSVHRGRGIKGHDVLLEAWRRFAGAHPNARLLLVGGGFDAAGEDYRLELLDRYQVDQRPSIRWIRSVPDVRLYYSAADLSVSPSLSENHGAALEASAMGVPCLVSDAGGLPETVDEKCGWVVASGQVEPLVAALEDAHRSWRVGTLGERGVAARARTLALFDRRAAAVRLTDIIDSTCRVKSTCPQ